MMSSSLLRLFVQTVRETGVRQIPLYNKKEITRWLEDMSYRFLELKTKLYSLAVLVRKILFSQHSKVKFIPRRRVITSMYIKS